MCWLADSESGMVAVVLGYFLLKPGMGVPSNAIRESVKCPLGLLFGQGRLSREGSSSELLANITKAREWVHQPDKEIWEDLRNASCNLRSLHFSSCDLKHVSWVSGWHLHVVHRELYMLLLQRCHHQSCHLGLIIFHSKPVFSPFQYLGRFIITGFIWQFYLISPPIFTIKMYVWWR